MYQAVLSMRGIRKIWEDNFIMKKFFILPFTIIFFVNQSYSQDLKTLVNDQSLKIYVQNELNFLAKGQNAEILKSIIKDKINNSNNYVHKNKRRI